MLRRTIQNSKNWRDKQSELLNKFVLKEKLETGVIHEEFPVGIRRIYKFFHPEKKHDYSIRELLGFSYFKDDLEMLNGLENYQLDNESISDVLGFLLPDNLQYIDAIFINKNEAWIFEIKYSRNSKEFRRESQKALGQILFYTDLFLEDYPDMKVKRKIILSGKRDSYELIDDTYSKYGIEAIWME